MPYNPFDKQPSEPLTESDLRTLVDNRVAEGFYVEYKSSLPETSKIAKSIASFANTYGGWLFYGISANKTSNTPEIINGLDLMEHKDPIATIRDAVRHKTNPIPFFQIQSCLLANGRTVTIVHVPSADNTPIVTYDGRIYRRAHDSSEPIPESDRHTIDELFQRGQKKNDIFKNFADDRRNLEGTAHPSWVSIYISPENVNPYHWKDTRSNNALKQLLKLTATPSSVSVPEVLQFSVGTPFKIATRTSSSIILRQTPYHPANPSLTLELDDFQRFSCHIPIFTEALHKINVGKLQNTNVRDLLLELNIKHNEGHLRAFDISKISFAAISMVKLYQTWLEGHLFSNGLQVAITTRLSGPTFAYFDSGEWFSFAKEYGTPIVTRHAVKYPENGSLLVENSSELWMGICLHIWEAFGLTHELLGHSIATVLMNSKK